MPKQEKINLSQAVSPQAAGKWERGESAPDITKSNRLAEIFGVPKMQNPTFPHKKIKINLRN
ncbi:helix-turn-helix transcriptional regulator [Emticicia sp. CRIBPO]|uniref:helix-turn-helix domain-containing protein n=1 Tax=Emticicia sp. CRIBPO TaxID=2683258 RepID=UPI00197ABEED